MKMSWRMCHVNEHVRAKISASILSCLFVVHNGIFRYITYGRTKNRIICIINEQHSATIHSNGIKMSHSISSSSSCGDLEAFDSSLVTNYPQIGLVTGKS